MNDNKANADKDKNDSNTEPASTQNNPQVPEGEVPVGAPAKGTKEDNQTTDDK